MVTKKKVAKKKAVEETVAIEATPAIEDEVSRDMLAEMDHASLVMFARLNYGMTGMTTKTNPREEVIDLIMNAARKFKGNAGMKVVAMNEEVEVPKDHVKIRVQAGSNNPNQRPVPLGLNFVMATIPVNKDVVMHKKWLSCLENAVQKKYFVDRTDPSRETLGYMEQHSYPFSILERGEGA